MADSKLTALILTQTFIILGIAIAGLTVYVFYLKRKIEDDSIDLPKEIISQTSTSTNHNNDQPASNLQGNDSWKLETFLNEEILANEKTYTSLSGHPIPLEIGSIDKAAEEKLLSIMVRHFYLKAELEALEHRKNPEPFWALLTPKLIELASLIPSKTTELSLSNLKSKNQELLNYQEHFFSLQKLIREHLPASHVAKLLPLTEEMSLIQNEEKAEGISKHYEQCFKEISEQFTEKLSLTSAKHAEEKRALTDIPSAQKQNIIKIEGFISELQEQNKLPLEQMNTYHNFLLDLKEQLNDNEKSFNQLKEILAESEMCTQFLESELAAAQETVKTLIENAEEEATNEQTAEKDERIKDLEQLIGRFANESRDMLMSIQMLQDENAELRKTASANKGASG